MDISAIAVLCTEAQAGRLLYSQHVAEQSLQRDQPARDEITYILCDDDPQIIERYPDDFPYRSCLIWGKLDSGRVGHIVCNYPPERLVITVYWPKSKTWEWRDQEYKIRIR